MIQFVFLICSERSGSNFVTSLMNGHSQVSGPSPSHLFRLFGTNVGNYGDTNLDANWEILVQDFVTSFQCKLGEWQTEISKETLLQCKPRTVASLLRYTYEEEARFDNATHVFVKENHTYNFSPFLLSHFPTCKFVFMTRDPRDVAASWVKTESIPGGVEKAIDTWLTDQSAAHNLFNQLRGTERMLMVKYEDIVSNPEKTLQSLTKFIGVPYEESMLEFYLHPRTRKNARNIDAWSNLSKPIIQGNTRKFLKVLSKTDIEYIEMRCASLMKELGYPLESSLDLDEPDIYLDKIEKVKPLLSKGNYVIHSEEEQKVRVRRLEAIEQVLARKL